MISRLLAFAAISLIFSTATQAQYIARLVLNKKQYVAGEAVLATVSITNHSGVEQIFANDGRVPWLDFIIRTSSGNPVSPQATNKFGAMKIAAGQTLAREVDLSKMFLLGSSGNYSVSAVVRPPGKADATATERVRFSQFAGTTIWSQKIGIMGGDRTRQYRLIQFANSQRTHAYVQVNDTLSGRSIATYPLSEMITLRRPVTTLDQHQRMHTLFLATPSAFVHCCVDSDGRLISRQVHTRAAAGDPRLVTSPDGSVMVANSIPYDPAAAAKQRATIRKASDRPPVAY